MKSIPIRSKIVKSKGFLLVEDESGDQAIVAAVGRSLSRGRMRQQSAVNEKMRDGYHLIIWKRKGVHRAERQTLTKVDSAAVDTLSIPWDIH